MGLTATPKAFAQTQVGTVTVDDVKYKLWSDYTASIGGPQTVSGTLTLHETVAYQGTTYTLTRIEDDAFAYYQRHFTGSLIIPATVTSIGYYAFRFATFTGELHLPESLISIGIDAFNGCGFTGTLTLPAQLTETLSYEADALKGFNLVGNPFAHNVTTFAGTNVATEVYRMNATKDNLMVSTISATDPLKPGEGFFVKATAEGASITFNAQTRGEVMVTEPVEVPTLTIDLLQDGLIVDRFILKRDGEPLEKLTLNENGTRIYATQGGKDYAVATVGRDVACNVSIDKDAARYVSTDEIPVNFKAAKNGQYTLTFNTENLHLDYLHLIDNMTGADVDLLPLLRGQGGFNNHPTYTFEAKTTDYASRFRLVFSEPADETSANRPFAYVSNGEIVIDGVETQNFASLQIVDMMGRVIRCTDGACTVSTSGMTPGVYVLRLIQGEDVRTQKIVID